ncbi:MAG TPA: hypothetical protein VIJ72_05210, partial [Rhizomicrobium sp.]
MLRLAGRYGLSTFGPVTISGAHFLASLIFLRNLPAAEFGLFSFVLVVVPFCMSMSGALVATPVATATHGQNPVVIASCLKLNLVLGVVAALGVFCFLMISHAKTDAALLLAGFGGALTFRWFLRCYAYVDGRIFAAIGSDIAYSGVLLGGLGVLVLVHRITLESGSAVLLLAALASLVPFGQAFARQQIAALHHGSLRLYIPVWRDMTRWSLIGVVFTEMTANAHAYFVTFISGPQSFALLALGMLLMRPVSLVQSALPDMERPVIAKAIAAHDFKGALRVTGEFRIALIAAWLGTVALAAGILIWFPGLLLKKGYDLDQVIAVTLLCAAIMAVRTLRAPHAVLLQAAGEFKALAGIGTKSSIVSIAATLSLLLAFGPIASL